MPEDRQQTVVRLPRELWRRAKIAAMDEGVSLNVLIVRALESALGNPSAEQPSSRPADSGLKGSAPSRASKPKKEKEPSSPSAETELPKIARRHWT